MCLLIMDRQAAVRCKLKPAFKPADSVDIGIGRCIHLWILQLMKVLLQLMIGAEMVQHRRWHSNSNLGLRTLQCSIAQGKCDNTCNEPGNMRAAAEKFKRIDSSGGVGWAMTTCHCCRGSERLSWRGMVQCI